MSKYPVGIYDHRPDPDASFISSVGVGSSRAASYGRELTKLVNEANDLISSIPGLR